MSVDFFTGILPISPPSALSSQAMALVHEARTDQMNGASAFNTLITNGITSVNSQLLKSQEMLQSASIGSGPSLHQVLLQMEESRLSFQLMMQVRNRLLESYQEVMRMQV